MKMYTKRSWEQAQMGVGNESTLIKNLISGAIWERKYFIGTVQHKDGVELEKLAALFPHILHRIWSFHCAVLPRKAVLANVLRTFYSGKNLPV